MDDISRYRQISLVLTVTPTGLVGSVFTRAVLRGRLADRLIARAIRLPGARVDQVSEIGPVLEQAVAAYLAGDYSPPR